MIKPFFFIVIISVMHYSEQFKRHVNQQSGLQNFVFDWSVLLRKKFDITIPFLVQPKIINYLAFVHIYYSTVNP